MTIYYLRIKNLHEILNIINSGLPNTAVIWETTTLHCGILTEYLKAIKTFHKKLSFSVVIGFHSFYLFIIIYLKHFYIFLNFVKCMKHC